MRRSEIEYEAPDLDCKVCRGSGRHLWSDTSCGMGGIAGQAFTEGPCSCTWPDEVRLTVLLRMGYIPSEKTTVEERKAEIERLQAAGVQRLDQRPPSGPGSHDAHLYG